MNIFRKLFIALMGGPIYIILFGLIFFGIGAGLTYRQRALEGQQGQVQGEVVSQNQSCDDDGCSYKPVVRFETDNGRTVSFEGTYSSSPPAYHIGETVTVVYSFSSPEKAVIKGEGQLFRVIFMIVGGVIIAIGLLIFGSNAKNSFSSE